ncbi:MAG: hypothetical protein ACYDAM_02965, partial [Leptospirales bacterium]
PPPLPAPVETDQLSCTEANSTEFPDPTLTRIQKITRATSPDELVQAMDDYIPGQLPDSELVALTRAYESKMSEFMPDEWPETPSREATLPGTPESGQRSQESRHPEQITPSYGWTGREVVIHDPSTCQNQICVNRRIKTNSTISTVKDSLTVPDPQDPEALAERIALKFEEITPAILGKPVIVDRGHVLACEGDFPHVKVYAWALLHLNTGEFRSLDISKAVKDCRLTTQEVREAIARLVKEGDLVVERSRKGDLLRLNIQYGGTV